LSEKKKDMGTPAAVRRARDVAKWDREADVVVVGLGGAGSCAAIEAAAAGAEVLVLERAWKGGGTSAMASGQLYMGGGTPLQKQCGFEDTPDEMFKYLVASCGPGADEDKIRFYCDRSVEHYHWLDALGVPFKPTYMHYLDGTDPRTDDGLSYTGSELAHPFSEIAVPAPRGHTVQQEGSNAGLLLMEKLLEAVEKAGAEVVVDALCETLVQDDDRRVVGVVAAIGGEEVLVRARRGVVLTAGGFIHNKDMVRRYAPMLRKCRFRLGCDGDDGRGIRMGQGAGGDAIRMDAATVVVPFSPPRQLICGLLVNPTGQRFVNEDVYQSLIGEICLMKQDGEVYLIVDDEIFVRPEVPHEIAAAGDTIEELERELGFPEGNLQHTVATYNRGAEKGEDPVFHKASDWIKPLTHPPYAAFDLTAPKSLYSTFTLGGLHTRPTGEVIDPDGQPIPGLYAAGRNTSGMPAQGYNSGLSLSDATFFGRHAGISAAAASGDVD
jgi:3-oxo-5alpha-steroid 4-dehydrogenase